MEVTVPRLAIENVQSLLNTGLGRHQAGDLQAARTFYEAVLAMEPDNVDGNFLLGTLSIQAKDYARAEPLLKRTLQLQPNAVPVLVNLGLMYQERNDRQQALQYYRAAIRLDPAQVDTLNNLATLLLEGGDMNEASVLLSDARRVAPAHVPTLLNSARVAQSCGDLDGAIHHLRSILERDPGNTAAAKQLVRIYLNRSNLTDADAVLRKVFSLRVADAELYYLQGELHERAGQDAAAVKNYQRALSLRQDFPDAKFRLAMTYHRSGAPLPAVALLKEAVALRPNFAEALSNLCCVLTELGLYSEAKAAGEQALRADPAYIDAYTNLGVASFMLAEFPQALEYFKHALTLDPSNTHARRAISALYQFSNDSCARTLYEALLREWPDDPALHWNWALLLLRHGELAQGWDEYEWGLKIDERSGPTLSVPYWQGEPLTGRTIAVVREQGIGDELMFASCLPDLIAAAGQTVVGCDSRLVALFRRSFPGCDVVAMSKSANADANVSDYRLDYYARIGSLPRHFRRSLGAFPAREAYLVADPPRVKHWSDWLAALGPGLKVGICWRSGLRTPLREGGFTELDQWKHLFSVPGVQWVNAQYGECEEELRRAEASFGITVHRPPQLDMFNDLDEVTALLTAFDMVVTAGTSVHVIAGAAGTATLMLGAAPVMSLGTLTEPWFKRVEQIREYEKKVTLRIAAMCVHELAALRCNKTQLNAVFTERVRHLTTVTGENPLIFVPPVATSDDCGEVLAWREYGEFARAEEECFERFVFPGAVVFDVGASIGIQTLSLIRYAGQNGVVRAIEPDPERWEELRQNLVANRVRNTEIFCHAVGDETQAIAMPKSRRQLRPVEPQPVTSSSVAVVRLDTMVKGKVDFIRICGMDRHLSVLRSAQRQLSVDRAIVYLVDIGDDDAQLRAFLSEQGYRVEEHIVPWVRMPNVRGREKNIFADRVERNLIGIPQERK